MHAPGSQVAHQVFFRYRIEVMRSKPVSYVKAHFAEVLREVQSSGEELAVTQSGATAALIVDPESWERMRRALAMMKLVTMADHDFARGAASPQSEVFKRVRQKLKKATR